MKNYIGNFVTPESCLRIGNVQGLKFITEEGEIKTAQKFEFSDAGTPYLWWDEYKAGMLIPAINLRLFKNMKWI